MIVIHCRVEVRRATVIWANGSWNRRCERRRRALAAGEGPSNKDLHLRSGAKFCRQVPLRLQNFKLCQHHRRPPQLATVTAISLSCFFPTLAAQSHSVHNSRGILQRHGLLDFQGAQRGEGKELVTGIWSVYVSVVEVVSLASQCVAFGAWWCVASGSAVVRWDVDRDASKHLGAKRYCSRCMLILISS